MSIHKKLMRRSFVLAGSNIAAFAWSGTFMTSWCFASFTMAGYVGRLFARDAHAVDGHERYPRFLHRKLLRRTFATSHGLHDGQERIESGLQRLELLAQLRQRERAGGPARLRIRRAGRCASLVGHEDGTVARQSRLDARLVPSPSEATLQSG